MGVSGKRYAPTALPPEMTRFSFYRRLCGPQGRSGRVRKISPLTGFDPRTVKPVTVAILSQHKQHIQSHFNRMPHIFQPLTQGWPTCGPPRRKNLRPSVPWRVSIIQFLCKMRHYSYVNPPPPPSFEIYIHTHTQVRLSGESLTKYVAILWVAFGQPCSNIQSTLR
jgi:hypothetical protein